MSETSAAHRETVESVRREKKARPDAGTEFLGVRRRPCGSYGAQIWDRSRRINVWLGTFGTAEDAAKAYDAATVQLQTTGRAARPNAWTEFHGVQRIRGGRYRSMIWHPSRGTKVHLGTFRTPEEAARAYDAAAVELDGAAAKTNFKVVDGISVQAVRLEKEAAGSSAFHGVYRRKSGKCPGTFDKAEDAASASDPEAVRLHGERATNLQQPHMDLNDFPELPALDISTIPCAQVDDLWTCLLQAELQPVDELLQDMDFTGVAA